MPCPNCNGPVMGSARGLFCIKLSDQYDSWEVGSGPHYCTPKKTMTLSESIIEKIFGFLTYIGLTHD